jgi:hypothetical protein
VLNEGAAEAVPVDWTVVVVVPVGGIETVALIRGSVASGAVAVIVAPETLIPEEKDVIDSTVVGMFGAVVGACCRGLRLRRLSCDASIMKNGP